MKFTLLSAFIERKIERMMEIERERVKGRVGDKGDETVKPARQHAESAPKITDSELCVSFLSVIKPTLSHHKLGRCHSHNLY